MYSVFLKLDIRVIFSTDKYRYIDALKESSYLGVQINEIVKVIIVSCKIS